MIIVKIRTWLATAGSVLLLAGCTGSEPLNFASMTPLEIDDYNRDRPIMEQIYCKEERRTGSHIRKMWCRTVQDWVEHNTRTMMALDTMNVRSGSVFRGGN